MNRKASPKHNIYRNWYQLILYYVYILFTIPNENDANLLKVVKTMRQNNWENRLVQPLMLIFLTLKWRNYGRFYTQIRASLLTLLANLLTALIGFSELPRPDPETGQSSTMNLTCQL